MRAMRVAYDRIVQLIWASKNKFNTILYVCVCVIVHACMHDYATNGR